jgi:hypothetical protein
MSRAVEEKVRMEGCCCTKQNKCMLQGKAITQTQTGTSLLIPIIHSLKRQEKVMSRAVEEKCQNERMLLH